MVLRPLSGVVSMKARTSQLMERTDLFRALLKVPFMRIVNTLTEIEAQKLYSQGIIPTEFKLGLNSLGKIPNPRELFKAIEIRW